jgi:zinc protease
LTAALVIATACILGLTLTSTAQADDTAPASPAATLPKAPLIGPAVTSFTLGNGLQVVVIPDHRAPVVTHMVWYKIGAADEPKGKSGIAHYLEHLMFKGTKENPAGTFSAKVAAIGGQENAFTSSDYTAYYQRVAKQHLGLMMSLEADRMQNLVLSEATARPELQVILEERSMRVDSDPSALLGEALDASLYLNHPYRIPVIGWRREMETLTYQDAIDFYNRHYSPENAILIVAGDVDEASVRSLADATYGKVPRRQNADVGPRVRPLEPEPNAVRSVTYRDERVSQSTFRRGYVVPSARTATGKESEALEVLAEIIGPSTTSRMYRSVVLGQQLATSAGAWYEADSYDANKFLLYATPRDGVTLDQLQTAMEKVVAEVAKSGPTDAELTRAKHKIVAQAINAQDNQATLARIFGEALATGSTVERVQTWPSRIYAVTAEDVKAVAEKYFTDERGVSGFLVNGANPVARRTAANLSHAPFPSGPIRMFPQVNAFVGRTLP